MKLDYETQKRVQQAKIAGNAIGVVKGIAGMATGNPLGVVSAVKGVVDGVKNVNGYLEAERIEKLRKQRELALIRIYSAILFAVVTVALVTLSLVIPGFLGSFVFKSLISVDITMLIAIIGPDLKENSVAMSIIVVALYCIGHSIFAYFAERLKILDALKLLGMDALKFGVGLIPAYIAISIISSLADSNSRK